MSKTAVWLGLSVQVLPLAAAAIVVTGLGAFRWSSPQRVPQQVPLLVGVGIAYIVYLLTRDHGPYGVPALLALALLVGLAGGGWLSAATTDRIWGLLGEVGCLLVLGIGLGRWRQLGGRLPQRPLLVAGWIYLAGWILLALSGSVGLAGRAWALFGLALLTLLSMAWSSRLGSESNLQVVQSAGDLYLLALNMAIARLILFALV